MRVKELSTKAATIANLLLWGCGVVCLMILFYVVYHYSWARDRDFTSPLGLFVYYGFPSVLAILCFASLRLRSAYKINLALFIVSVGASIYAAEIFTTLWFSLPSVKAEQQLRESVNAAKGMGIDFDTRSLLEVVNDLRNRGVDAYPVVYPGHTDYGTKFLPLAGISSTTSVLCNESGEYVIFESDEHGFNNLKDLWHKSPVDVVALGDSYVQGFCVPTGKNFVDLIRKSYPATINLGNAGHGPLLMLATLKEYAQFIKPKIVLWFYYEGNDLNDLRRREKKSAVLMRYLQSDFTQGLVDQQADIDRGLIAYVERIRNKSELLKRLEEIADVLGNTGGLPGRSNEIAKLTQLRQKLGLIYGTRRSSHRTQSSSERSDADIELLSEILLQAKNRVSTWGGEIYFIYLPTWHRYAEPGLDAVHRDLVLKLVTNMGFHVIDIHDAFTAQKDPLTLFPFRLHHHYNETGHRLVAETVLESISRDGQVSQSDTGT